MEEVTLEVEIEVGDGLFTCSNQRTDLFAVYERRWIRIAEANVLVSLVRTGRERAYRSRWPSLSVDYGIMSREWVKRVKRK